MKKKMTYFAPETEQMDIKFEQNIMSDVQRATEISAETNGWAWDD